MFYRERERLAIKALKRIIVLVITVLSLAIVFCYGQNIAEQAKQSWNKGVEYASQGKFKEAKEEFEKALKIDPYYGSAKRALKVIEDVTEKKLKHKTVIHIFKGITHTIKGQVEEAITEHSKAIEINPKYAWAYNNRGTSYYSKGEYDKAWVDIHKARSLGYQVHPEFLKALREASGRHEQHIVAPNPFVFDRH